jgi:hypothetical protein
MNGWIVPDPQWGVTVLKHFRLATLCLFQLLAIRCVLVRIGYAVVRCVYRSRMGEAAHRCFRVTRRTSPTTT